MAHEDHALRSCYASLARQAAMRNYTEAVRRTHGIHVKRDNLVSVMYSEERTFCRSSATQRRPELARGLVSRLLPIDALHSAEPIRAGQQLGLSIRVSDVPHVLTHHTSAPLDVPRPMWDDWTRIRLEN